MAVGDLAVQMSLILGWFRQVECMGTLFYHDILDSCAINLASRQPWLFTRVAVSSQALAMKGIERYKLSNRLKLASF